MYALKLIQIGQSLGIILPAEVLERLKVAEGSAIYLCESAGGYQLTSDDFKVAKQLEVARAIMDKRRSVLRELSRS